MASVVVHMQLLGRADRLDDYVHRGKDSGWTEITLSAGRGERDYVIRRDIEVTRTRDEETGVVKQGYHSSWRVNGGCRLWCWRSV